MFNILNSFFIIYIILLVINKPVKAVYIFLSLVLLLPAQFRLFGFSFLGNRGTVDNYTIIGLIFTLRYFYLVSIKKIKISKTDTIILLYIIISLIISSITTTDSLSLNYYTFFVKRFMSVILVYFVGKIFFHSIDDQNYEIKLNNLLKYLKFIGIYLASFCMIEYISNYNIFVNITNAFVKITQSKSISSVDLSSLYADYKVIGFYRYLGPFLESTETAIIILLIISLLIPFIEYNNITKKTKNLYLIGLLAFVIFLGSTRAVMFTLFILIVVSVLFNEFPKKILFSIIFVSLFIYLINPDNIIHDFENSAYFYARLNDEGSGLSRLIAGENGIAIFLQHPILGVGVGTPIYALQYKGADINTTHNFYLDRLVWTGILGTLFYLSIIYTIFIKALLLFKQNNFQKLRRIGLSFILLSISIWTVYLFNMEKITAGTIFWFFAGGIIYYTNKLGDINPHILEGSNYKKL